jgi:hypothetical protein
MTLPDRLPKACPQGHYWLGSDRTKCAVILKAGDPEYHKAPSNAHGYFASMGAEGGVIFDGTLIKYYENPVLALEALRDYEERKSY